MSADKKTVESTYSGDLEIAKYKEGEEYTSMKEKGRVEEETLNLSGESIKDYLSSEKATTVIISMAINDGTGGAPQKISKGIRDYAISKKVISKAVLKSANEIDILKSIKKYAFRPKRIDEAINSSSLSSK